MSRLELNADAFGMAEVYGKSYLEDDVLPQIRDRAKRIVPVDTGALRESIHIETEEGFYVVASTDYAVFVEQGTSKMAAQPYLRPAATSSALPPKSKG